MKDMLNMRTGAWIELNSAGVVFPRWPHSCDTSSPFLRLANTYLGAANAIYGCAERPRKYNVYRIVP